VIYYTQKEGEQMSNFIVDEYRSLLDKKQRIRSELKSIPQGYISQKNRNGTIHYYLQRREGTKVVSQYLPPDVAKTVSAQISSKKQLSDEILKINERMHQIEQAANLLSKKLRRELLIYEQCSGMDEMPLAERAECVLFGEAMTSLEGVPVSEETAALIRQWEHGEIPYLRIFKITLEKYGVEIDE